MVGTTEGYTTMYNELRVGYLKRESILYRGSTVSLVVYRTMFSDWSLVVRVDCRPISANGPRVLSRIG